MYLSLFISLLVIMNPIGNAAIYIGLISSRNKREQRATAIICAIAIFIILLLSLWVGWPILKFFGISLAALKVAGGLIVLRIALSMLKGTSHTHDHDSEDSQSKMVKKPSIAVVPMAIPIIAGPGAISVMITNADQFHHMTSMLIVSILCAVLAFIIWLVLAISPWLGRLLGEQGMQIVSRVMGLILAAIAVGMLQGGLGSMFPGWLH